MVIGGAAILGIMCAILARLGIYHRRRSKDLYYQIDLDRTSLSTDVWIRVNIQVVKRTFEPCF